MKKENKIFYTKVAYQTGSIIHDNVQTTNDYIETVRKQGCREAACTQGIILVNRTELTKLSTNK